MGQQNPDVELCWQFLSPLVQRASQILAQFREFSRQADHLNELKQRAMAAIARGRYPRPKNVKKQEPHWTVVNDIDGLRKKLYTAPQALCKGASAAIDQLRKVVPAPIVEALEQKIDVRFVRQTCLTLIAAEQELHLYGGPPLADRHAPMDKTSVLLDDAEFVDLDHRVAAMETESLRKLRKTPKRNRPRPARKPRGPQPNVERHRAIASAVKPFMPDWKPHLDEIAETLDQSGIAPSLAWQAKKQARKARTWDRAAEYYPQRVIKAIERSVEMARRSP